MAKTATAAPTGANGSTPEQGLAEAIAYEEAIAVEAAEIRGEDFRALDAQTFLKLWPLSRRAIPAGFIKHVPAGTGKPYDSDGVRSFQVQINRMDNVWTPLGWGWRTEWFEGDKLAEVTVWVGPSEAEAFARRSARGGVDRGSTVGNVAKGTETNAGKLAFGRIGPGNEIYLGAADFDPDTDPDAAKEQGKTSTAEPERKVLTQEQADRLEGVVEKAGLKDHLPMKLRGFGVSALTELDSEQATKVYEWAAGANG